MSEWVNEEFSEKVSVYIYITYSTIVINDQQDATISDYLFIPNQLYMFRAMFSPIIRSTWMYLQFLVLSTDIAAGRQQYRWTVP